MECPYCQSGCELCELGHINIPEDATCEACDYKAPLTAYSGSPIEKRIWLLCKICAATASGNAAIYRNQSHEHRTLRMMAYCTNLILKAIKQ